MLVGSTVLLVGCERRIEGSASPIRATAPAPALLEPEIIRIGGDQALVRRRISIPNDAAESWEIAEVGASCACTSTEIVRRRAKPGEELVLDCSIRVNRAGLLETTVWIVLADGQTRSRRIVFDVRRASTLVPLVAKASDDVWSVILVLSDDSLDEKPPTGRITIAPTIDVVEESAWLLLDDGPSPDGLKRYAKRLAVRTPTRRSAEPEEFEVSLDEGRASCRFRL
jgi:hypothetical protein